MGADAQEIAALIRHISGTGKYEVLEGTVTKVDEAAMTIDVKIEEGVELYDIKLRAVSDEGKDGFVLVPKKDSHVVFALVRGAADYVLVSTSEIDKVLVAIGDDCQAEISATEITASIKTSSLKMNASGFEIKRGSETLNRILADLVKAINKLTVPTGTGPSGVPINTAEFTAIGQRIGNLLT